MDHRTRLALRVALLAGAVLAALFWGVVLAFHASGLAILRAELAEAVAVQRRERGVAFSPDEVREARPEIAASVFDASGRLARSAGARSLPPLVGFAERGSLLLYGERLGDETVVVAMDRRPQEAETRRLRLALAVLWPALVLLFGGAAWIAANAIFRPLAALGESASEISGRDLAARLPVEGRTEFGRFAVALNAMLDRIERAARREERFAADAAHELRTPLAVLKTGVETTLLRERTPGEYAALLKEQLKELDRLNRTVATLLATARGEEIEAREFDAAPPVRETLNRWKPRADSSRVRLRAALAPVRVRMAPHEIGLVLDNLLDNALRYAPDESEIEVSLTEDGALVVRDRGPGFPPDLLERAFDRLVQGDASRTRGSTERRGGAGLGLALVRRVLEARGGAITAHNDGGAVLTVRLPLAERRFPSEPSAEEGAVRDVDPVL